MDERFQRLIDLILKWNRKINITGLKNPEQIRTKLIEDSLAPLKLGLLDSPAVDVGCGGGFPTLPLAIAEPNLKIFAVDSSRKKINFLRHALRELELKNVEPIHDRIERCIHRLSEAKTFLSKAFMPPKEVIEFLTPLLPQPAKLIIYSTPKEAEKFEGPAEIHPYTLSDGTKRCLIVLRISS